MHLVNPIDGYLMDVMRLLKTDLNKVFNILSAFERSGHVRRRIIKINAILSIGIRSKQVYRSWKKKFD